MDLEVTAQVVDRRQRILGVVQTDQSDLEVGLGRRVFAAPVDHLEKGVQRLRVARLLLQLLSLHVERIVGLRRQLRPVPVAATRQREPEQGGEQDGDATDFPHQR